MEPIIEAHCLKKSFNGLVAVNNLGFKVYRGEIFGFLGPNGAGKTTTIRMLTGLLIPDSGDIFIDRIDIRRNPIKAKMKMGIIPETGNTYRDLTAKQNIILAGKFYGIPLKELNRRADSLLGRFGLYERKDESVKVLSKGLKQRVNIASALVHNPEILFLDEPTSGLDVQSQRLIRDIIKEMNERGATIFLTTHNIEEANIMCERIGIIHKGKIAAIDTPERLKRAFEQTQSVELSFSKAIGGDLLESSGLVSKMEKLGDKWKLYTNDPDKLIKQLSCFAQDRDVAFTSLEICGSSLEDVFVRLTEDTVHAE